MDEILRAPHTSRGQGGEADKESFAARLRRRVLELEGRAEGFRQRHAGVLHRFDRALAGGRNGGALPFLALATVVGVCSVVGTVYTPAYVVSVDGVPLGLVQNQQVFERVVERVEARATSILGYDYTLEEDVTYDFALTQRDKIPSTAGFETYLFNQIGEVMKSYVLSVNGQVIGTAADKADIDALLDSIKQTYQTENTVSASFADAVTITHEYTPTDLQQDLDAMYATLTANTNGQTTYEVQKGDTFMALAFANGMSMEEMEALNPGVDVNRLQIGQILNIKEEIPFLSVQTVDAVSYTEAIPCPVEQVNDDSMYQGDKKVLTQGVEGEALVSADVTYLNGRETGRTVTDTQVLSEATTTVVAVGTKERPSWMPKGYFIWPVYGRVTSGFGYRSIFGSYSYHGGIDIATSYGTGISAADGGTVTFAGRATGSNWSYGNLVIIDHGNGKQTYYGHCSSVLVSKGDHVYQGQTIARVGSTGRSTGNHCHFEVKINGTSVNPYGYLP